MDALPMVSVLIPLYNAGAYFQKSIASILNQTYSNLEIIICDDASTDLSGRRIEPYNDKRIRLIRNEINRGYLRTVNLLMSEARAEFIAFHDADDISHPRRIELQMEFLKNNPAIDLVGTNFQIIDADDKVIHRHLHQLDDDQIIAREILKRNVFQKPSILFRRKVYKAVGGFREGFLKLSNISEDYDWLVRAAEVSSLSNINYQEALYSYRSVSTAMTKSFVSFEQYFGEKFVQLFASQRKNGEMDSLQREDWDFIQKKISEWSIPYKNDSSLFYFEKAEGLLYSGLYQKALLNAWKAFMRKPFLWRNIKCLIHSLGRSLDSA